MKILHVAEKPDAAKKIAGILSNGGAQRRNSNSKYNPIWSFPSTFPPTGDHCEFIVTSLIGHIIDNDLEEKYRKWFSTQVKNILDPGLVKIDRFVRKDVEGIAKNLRQESKFCDHLVLWLDCDREGENIAFEVIEIVKKENPNKWTPQRIWRAKFSEITPRAIHYAIEHLAKPNVQESNAVEARKEIDLRIGCAYTRYQTIHIKNKFNVSSASGDNEKFVISYGPCQFPTLGFVVERYLRAKNFVSEKFWTINVNHQFPNPNSQNAIEGTSNDNQNDEETENTSTSKGKSGRKPANNKNSKKNSSLGDDLSITFTWTRGHLFDQLTTLVLYEQCVKNPTAKVVGMEKKKIKNYRPFPLNTVELQKLSSSILKLSAQQTMKIAEDLYNKGFISYPRTETNHYSLSVGELQHLIDEQNKNPTNGFKQYCEKLLHGDEFLYPKAGKSDDKAHPPIHPTKVPEDLNTLSTDERRVYELVSRHFLASMGKDGEGSQTNITIEIANETFRTTGVMIEAYHYLEIYIYSKWNGKVVPVLVTNQTFVPDSIIMQEGQTARPPLLSETELISLMDKNGIGTDATIATHIDTIQKRGYAIKKNNVFEPTNLGVALVQGYDAMGFELSKPNLRAKMEAEMKLISEGKKTKEVVIKENLDMYKQVLVQMEQHISKLDVEFSRYFPAGSMNNQ